MNQRKLRLGILLDSDEVPAWAYHSLERIVNSDYAEFSLVILKDSKGGPQSKFKELWENKHSLVYHLFNKIDEKLFRKEPDALEPKNLPAILSQAPVLTVQPMRAGPSECLEAADIDRIRGYGLDILIRLGFRDLQGDILTAAKYGVWSYHHGDYRTNRGGPAGFWEVVESRPETGAILHVLGEPSHNCKILYQSWFFTYPFSPVRNRNYCFWASSSFLPRQIELLYRLGAKRFFSEITRFNQEFDFYDGRAYKIPSNLLALKLIARLLAKLMGEIYLRIFQPGVWYLMFTLDNDLATTFCDFRKIFPPPDRFWADPHVIQSNGTYYVFIEEYVYQTKKGHISVIEIDHQGNYKDPLRVLEKDYHLSYPFVFEWADKYFMVPESAENRTIDLYEGVNFPNRWEFKARLMENVKAVDTTLFYYREKWWLFTGLAETEGSFPQVELFLFFSDDLFSRAWTPHPLNPIVSDIKRARPAGKLFIKNGKIFRPSQYCSSTYGLGFDLNEIVRLSETEYLERKVVSVRPHWDKKVQATHTFTREGQLTIIDALTRRAKPAIKLGPYAKRSVG